MRVVAVDAEVRCKQQDAQGAPRSLLTPQAGTFVDECNLISTNSATVRDVCFVDDRTLASAGGGDFGVRLWDVGAPSSSDPLAVLHGHKDAVFGVRALSTTKVGVKMHVLLQRMHYVAALFADCVFS